MKNFENSNRLYPFRKKNRFYNHADDKPESFIFHTIPEFIKSIAKRKSLIVNKSDWIEDHGQLSCPVDPAIFWMGHSTFLIQIAGITILTDPVFDTCSRLFPRILPVGICPEKLPKIDIVLLSHNHWDHTDLPSLRRTARQNPDVQLLVPQGDKWWLEKKGFANVQEFDWWQNFSCSSRANEMSREISFTFLPARHWSQHGLFDANKSLWGSWMICHGDDHIYFAGDTAYGVHFEQIAKEFKVTTALMPIAPCEPTPWMRRTHLDAHEAVQSFIDLKAQNFIPMHWGTFPFGTDTFLGPIERLKDSWQKQSHSLQDRNLHILKLGQRHQLKK